MKGKLIAFEGGEGSGKSTVIDKTVSYLEENGVSVLKLREPGGVTLSEKIRELILSQDMDPVTEAMLFAASRAELMAKKIIPALESGINVILDRSVFSSLCYQGYCGIGVDVVESINNHAMRNHFVDHVILLDVDPEIGLKRAFERNDTNRIDEKSLDYHKKVRKGYLYLANRNDEIFDVVDANKSIDDVLLETKIILNSIFDIKVDMGEFVDFTNNVKRLLGVSEENLIQSASDILGVQKEKLLVKPITSISSSESDSSKTYLIKEKFDDELRDQYAQKIILKATNGKISRVRFNGGILSA